MPRNASSERLKILLINDYGTPEGGAEIITLGLRDELRARGHEVRFFASSAARSPQARIADAECFGTTGSFRTLLQSANFMALALLRSVLREFRPDIVHVNLYLTQLSPFILLALKDVPSVYYAQWYRAVCPRGTKHLRNGEACRFQAGRACLAQGCLPLHDWLPLELQRLLDRRWRGTFDGITAISRAVAEKLTLFGGSHFNDVEVLHAGTAIVPPREALTEHPSVFFAGRLVPEKGVNVLLKAFSSLLKKLPLARLTIVGQGPERERLEALASSLGMTREVSFMGHLSNQETKRLMRSAWVVSIPSVWEEPFGLIAAEAQMNGVPVIASRIGGLVEIIRENLTGFLVDPGSPEALAEKLELLLADREKVVIYGAEAHRHARENLSLNRFAERFEEVYGRAIRSHSKNRPS